MLRQAWQSARADRMMTGWAHVTLWVPRSPGGGKPPAGEVPRRAAGGAVGISGRLGGVAPSGADRSEHGDDQRDEQDGNRRRRYRADPVEARGHDSGRERDRDRYALMGEDLLGDLAPGLALGQGQRGRGARQPG